MGYERTHTLLQRFVDLELIFCRQINHSFSAPAIQGFFALISRLGDGVFWYGLIICLPLIYGREAFYISMLMVCIGILNLVVYKILKKLTSRERPCSASADIIPGARLLDHYSFPSGHTLHAVGFTTVVFQYYPALAWYLVPFAVLVAMSRIVLGLHYPTDVAAGALIGALIAIVGIAIT